METGLVFSSGMLAGAGVALLGVVTGRTVKLRRKGTRVVMFSRQEQARDLAGISTDEPAQRPVYLTTTERIGLDVERRQSERPAEPLSGWSDAGSWVDLGAPQEATVTLLHGDTHRPERCGGVIRFRRVRGEARDG